MPGVRHARPHQRQPALKKAFLALLGAIAGALIGTPVLAIALGALMSEIYGTFVGAAAMAGMSLGSAAAMVVGAGFGLWLVLRRGGKHAGVAAAALCGGGFIAVMGFLLVAFD